MSDQLETRAAMKSADDTTLLSRWRAGDRAAGDALMHRYDRYARRRLAVRVRANDIDQVVQLVLIRFMNALPGYEGRGTVRSYYATVEGRAVLDYYRQCYRDPVHFDPELVTMEDLDAVSPSRQLSLQRHLGRLMHALETELSLVEKLVVEQVLMEGIPVAVVARGLERAESSVRGILMRARRKLKAKFGDDYMEIARGDELEFDLLALHLAELGLALRNMSGEYDETKSPALRQPGK